MWLLYFLGSFVLGWANGVRLFLGTSALRLALHPLRQANVSFSLTLYLSFSSQICQIRICFPFYISLCGLRIFWVQEESAFLNADLPLKLITLLCEIQVRVFCVSKGG